MKDSKQLRPRVYKLQITDDTIRSWNTASRLEWLVTNGIGGYASGSLSGANTRRYHGFLMAALAPPAGRTLLVARIEETVSVEGRIHHLWTNQWWDESISPPGGQGLQAFTLEDGLPVFTYAIGEYLLEKRVWMEPGENLTWAAYTWPKDAPPAILSIRLCMAYRDFHSSQHGSSDWKWKSEIQIDGIGCSPGEGCVHSVVRTHPFTSFTEENAWYWGFLHQRERERGLDDVEDLWVPGSLELALCGGDTAGLLASAGGTSHNPSECLRSLERERRRRAGFVNSMQFEPETEEEAALAASADSFLVKRPIESSKMPDRPNTIVAGYHWFGDWGRDTMIALPGLTLTTGRPAEARQILQAYSHLASEGMLPNRFPDSGGTPEYNTVDATLWYFQAIDRYIKATRDDSLLKDLFPCLQEIIAWHERGTRHGIGMDPSDGLLRAGEPGSQLTWMDARVGDWTVTPRTGKPVEIVALWYNALRLMSDWAIACGADGSQYTEMAARAEASFGHRFWVPGTGTLFDVIDGPDGDDLSFRPNQLIALSLLYPLASRQEAKVIVEACRRRLLTPCGLRTLDPADSRYVGEYGGDQWKRDGAYHQGTAWAWLIGPYVDAALYAYEDPQQAREALNPILARVRTAGIGTLSEIFDGDYPHRPRGCIAQAWSVAEVLRSIQRLREAEINGVSPHAGPPNSRKGTGV